MSRTAAMFTDRDRLKKLTTLNAGENSVLEDIKEDIAEQTNDNIDEYIKQYQTRPAQLIAFVFRLSQNDKMVDEHFNKDPHLNEAWVQLLSQYKGYPAFEMRSLDNKESISIFSRLKGAYLIAQDPEFNDIGLLTECCRLGMYQALVTRLTRTKDFIEEKAAEQKTDISTYINQMITKIILPDVTKVGNLYWSIGFINAANALFNLAKYCFTHPSAKVANELFQQRLKKNRWTEEYKKDDCPPYVTFLKVAMESFYKAMELKDHEISKKITACIYPEHGLLTGFHDQIKNAEDAENYFKNFISSLGIEPPGPFCEQAKANAKKEVEILLSRTENPAKRQ